MPIDEIVIVHFSGKVGPHDFLFQDAQSDFRAFVRTTLLDSWGTVYANDGLVMEEAAMRWYAAYKDAWMGMVSLVALSGGCENRRCPLCREGALNLEHTFWCCKDAVIQRLRREWETMLTDTNPLCLFTALHDPREFLPGLWFLNEVYKHRLPDPEGSPVLGDGCRRRICRSLPGQQLGMESAEKKARKGALVGSLRKCSIGRDTCFTSRSRRQGRGGGKGQGKAKGGSRQNLKGRGRRGGGTQRDLGSGAHS